jgi:hypothetical protein
MVLEVNDPDLDLTMNNAQNSANAPVWACR